MSKIRAKSPKGVTLIELMITVALAAVVILGLGIVMADNLSSWRRMYSRLHSNTAEQCYEIRRVFDRVVRRASVTSPVYLSDNFLQVDYFEYPESGSPFRCRASFSYSGGRLTVQCKRVSNNEILENWTIENVTACQFKSSGRSIQMLLTVKNESNNPTESFSENIEVVSTAFISDL